MRTWVEDNADGKTDRINKQEYPFLVVLDEVARQTAGTSENWQTKVPVLEVQAHFCSVKPVLEFIWTAKFIFSQVRQNHLLELGLMKDSSANTGDQQNGREWISAPLSTGSTVYFTLILPTEQSTTGHRQTNMLSQ